MKWFKKIWKIIEAIVPIIIATVAPEAMINTTIGGVVKHLTPIPNNSIPVLNLLISSAVMYGKKVATSGDWHGSLIPAIQAGVVMMATSTALHQSIKIPLSEMVMSPLASKVGPGKKFSI